MLLVGWALIMVCGHICLNYLILAPQEVQEGRPLDPSLPASGWVPNLGVLMALGHGPSQVGSLQFVESALVGANSVWLGGYS